MKKLKGDRMKIKDYISYLKELNACSEAIEWSKQFKTSQEAWNNCERGDWMLWLLDKQAGKPESKNRKKLVLAACRCARLSLKHIPKNEKRPLKAIQAAEKWAKGVSGVSLQDVKDAAAYAADAAAYTAYAVGGAHAAAYAADVAAYAAAYAADAAAYAADAAAYTAYAVGGARAAACAAYAAAYAADAAAYTVGVAGYTAHAAAFAVGDADARVKTLKKCAGVVYKYYPELIIKRRAK